MKWACFRMTSRESHYSSYTLGEITMQLAWQPGWYIGRQGTDTFKLNQLGFCVARLFYVPHLSFMCQLSNLKMSINFVLELFFLCETINL